MPKTKKKYPQVISSAVTQELYSRIIEEAESQECSLSTLVRRALEDYYSIEYPETYTISVEGEELAALEELGYTITRQE